MRAEYVGHFRLNTLMDAVLSACPSLVVPIDDGQECLLYLAGTDNGVRMEWPDHILSAEQMDAIVAAHDPDALTAVEIERARAIANQSDVRDRWNLAALKDKTPAELYTLMQGRMDAWSNLAAAKADLREWLPLMAAAIAWMVIEERK